MHVLAYRVTKIDKANDCIVKLKKGNNEYSYRVEPYI